MMNDMEAFDAWLEQSKIQGTVRELHVARAAWQAALASERAKQAEQQSADSLSERQSAHMPDADNPTGSSEGFGASAAVQAEPVDVTRDQRVLLAACLLHPLPLALANAIKEVLAAPHAAQAEPDKMTDPVERARYWKLRALAAEGQVRAAQQSEPVARLDIPKQKRDDMDIFVLDDVAARKLGPGQHLLYAATPAVQAEPVAWERAWSRNGETPKKERNENGRMAWPKRFKFLPVTKAKILPDDFPLHAAPPAVQGEPVAWVAKGPNGGVYHLSKIDGWTVDPVVFAPPAVQAEPRTTETTIYDFAGWLTCRNGVMPVGSTSDAAPMAEAVGEYIKTYPERFAAPPAAQADHVEFWRGEVRFLQSLIASVVEQVESPDYGGGISDAMKEKLNRYSHPIDAQPAVQAEPVASLHDNKTAVTEPHPMLSATHSRRDPPAKRGEVI